MVYQVEFEDDELLTKFEAENVHGAACEALKWVLEADLNDDDVKDIVRIYRAASRDLPTSDTVALFNMISDMEITAIRETNLVWPEPV